MCGINVIVSPLDNQDLASALSKMNKAIVHRGPDDNGVFISESENYSIGLGMQRLSIIDLDLGKQPMQCVDGNLVIVFNGEIYNYKTLKTELENEGVIFSTNSDTEVILNLYKSRGTKGFELLDGMFAFAMYDKQRHTLIVARDYFGEKPLHYALINSNFYVASELKSLLKVLPNKPEIDPVALNLYFQLTYIPAPYTIYQGIRKLERNSVLELNCETFAVNTQEIEFAKNREDSPSSLESAKEVTRKKVSESVQSRSVADVEVGCYLSGGVDSSIVALCHSENSGKPISTFGVSFDNPSFNESEKAFSVAKIIKSKHHNFLLTEQIGVELTQRTIINFDEPFADSSAIASAFLAQQTSNYVKVVLTGDGGDEAFGGYNKYLMGKINSRYTNLVPSKFHQSIAKGAQKLFAQSNDERGLKFKLNRLFSSIDYSNNWYLNIISLGFQESDLVEILSSDWYLDNVIRSKVQGLPRNFNSLNHLIETDLQLSLEGDLLPKVDRTSMQFSLECRSPFLNRAIFEFTSQLPEQYLIKGFNKKRLLKAAFSDDFPKGFLDLPKKGFGVPVGEWLRGVLKSELLHFADNEALTKQGIFNPQAIKSLIQNHLSGKRDHSFQLYTFYCFQLWYYEVYLVVA